MTLREQILALADYRRGNEMTRAEILSRLKLEPTRQNQNGVSSALIVMEQRGELHRTAEGKFHKPRRHWIHSRRLATPVLTNEDGN